MLDAILNSLWINILPPFILTALPGLSLVIAGGLVERNFVGRIATFCNTIAINLHVLLLSNASNYLVWYANIGLIMGIIGVVAYQNQSSLSQYYYYISWLYCSILVGVIILFVH